MLAAFRTGANTPRIPDRRCPAMSTDSTSAAPSVQRIGWRGDAPVLRPGHTLARVSAQHRAGYEVHDGVHAFNAQPAPKFLKRGLDAAARPAVGDFVVIEAGAPPHIVEILPRRGVLERAAAGDRYARQIIATNVDVVFVLTGFDHDFNPARIERYLALTEGSGARAVAVLTKLDLADPDDAEAALADLRKRLPAATPIVAVNGKDAGSLAALEAFLTPGTTAVLVGSSGAGKSTLTNSLLGEDRMETGATRANDSHGRHTTTHRALLPLLGGACLIDTPGMRELQLTGAEDLELFDDIEELIAQCRFTDCSHGNEPGCAVRAALEAGDLDHERWQHYLKLRDQREEQAERFEARLRDHHAPTRAPRRRDDRQERD